MGVLPASLLALIYTLSITNQVIAQSSSPVYTFKYEIAQFVPRCAQLCFTNFVDTNFPESTCSMSPTLDCLCTHNTTSGFTIGEGAAQCIIMENNVGFCDGDSGSSQISDKAYNMCLGRSNAFPNTHAELTASLFIESASQSTAQVTSTSAITSVATSSTASVTTSSGTSAPTTSASSKPASSRPTSTTLSPTTSATASTSASASTSATVVASAQDSSAPATGEPQLSSPQVAGIVVASVGAASLAIGAIAIAACMRRRRRKARERDHNHRRDSYLRPFQLDPSRGLGDFNNDQTRRKYGAPGPTRNGIAKKIGPPVPPRVCTDPNMFSRRSLRPDQIEVEVPPDRKQLARSSRLLPEKPILRLHVPPEPVARRVPPPRPFPMSQNMETNDGCAESNRESGITNFEEDNTPYIQSNSGANASYYDKCNNDVMISQATAAPISSAILLPAAMHNTIRPLEITRPGQSFSQPTQLSMAISNRYPGQGSLLDNTIDQRHASWELQPPHLQQPQHKAYKPCQQPSERIWAETVTGVNSQRESLPGPMPVPAPLHRKSYIKDRQSIELSPVTESPVSYPKIPKPSPIMTYPPLQSGFQQNRGRNHQQQQRPPQQLPYVAPWLQAEKDAARMRNQAKQTRSEKEEEYRGYSSYNTPLSSVPTQVSSQSQLLPRTNSTMSIKSPSSLLEKRRGKEQAANLILLSAQDDAARMRAQEKCHVSKDEGYGIEQEMGRKPQAQTRSQYKQWSTAAGQDRVELPKTPLWSQELTPKMRNGEMYLTVH